MTDTPQPFDLANYVKEITESAKYLKMLVYGFPKVGKTTFAGTAPNPLFIAVEPGIVTLVKNEENRERFKNVRWIGCKNIEALNVITQSLRAGQVPDRETVVLDTLSEFEDKVLQSYMNKVVADGKKDNLWNPEWPEYKAVTGMLKQAILELRDLPRHVVVLCHLRDDPDKSRGGMNVYRPDLMPKLGNSLTAMFNLVGYMFKEDVNGQPVVKMRVEPTPNIVAGNHIWSGAAIIENPTFDMFQLERAMNVVRSE